MSLPGSGDVALVGNAPSERCVAAEIDAAGHVVRFNNAPGFGAARGSRVDELVLINCGGQMREWLEDAAFAERVHVAAAGLITLPIAPETADDFRSDAPPGEDGINHGPAATARLEAAGKRVRVLPATAFRRACGRLGVGPLNGSPQTPSTGFLLLSELWDRRAPGTTVHLFGFAFEGWGGHPFARERAWVEERCGAGLVLHPI